MTRKNLAVLLIGMATLLCHGQDPDPLKYANPFIGTDKMGHTYPGATVPFGMVQLSPDTDTLPYEVDGSYNRDVYKYCAGYQYEDPTIVGFSHTHFSGTGHSDLGDILLMPTVGALQLNPGTADAPEKGYRSRFSHVNEKASPGYYSVLLEDHDILAELTATTRTGVHRYTFNDGGEAHVILDMVHGIYNDAGKNVWTFIRVENDTLVTGFRQTSGWARTRSLYFAIAFSKPFISYGFRDDSAPRVYRGFWRRFDQRTNFPEAAGRNIRGHFDFPARPGEQITVRVSLSPVSTDGAVRNMIAEAPRADFESARLGAEAAWRKELERVKVTMMNEDQMTSFYTSLYHTFLSPTVFMDTDGSYLGLDQNIHRAEGFTNYTTFSLWDTYRALHPIFTILQQKRTADMISSMLVHYDQSVHHMLPVWSHHANENWCMIGYHAVPVIADAIVKRIEGFDYARALEACITTARNGWYDGLDDYMRLGYVPDERTGSSVSVTLEYAYDDWCIAQAISKLPAGQPEGRYLMAGTTLYDEFIERSRNFLNVWDESVGFMRPRKSDGTFRNDFDVLSTHGQGFIEGNAWNYSLYVPHDPAGLIRLHGGKERFTEHLDSLFTMYLPDSFFAETEDITREGIIGNYVHGNEPSHHVPYLYNYAGAPRKTQYWVRHIMDHKYLPAPEGLSGNDDCGQMSAWYIFSALGFYPVAPGSDRYDLGSPLVKEAAIMLENGRKFTVTAVNQGPKNIYVRKAELNGTKLDRLWITHDEIMEGGSLVFYMSNRGY
ncbi:MAG TPA: GH92 family glycosyl hydrolase [Bacteroidales bacterium]|nr:GH92 family glycosyl hydrolase [Bacteroidales bacterium]HPE23824.1 GH92 family glycosyl hydrolase [Bacteroidales bacterium]HPJ06324.1 GH92 family glycosyl hydrolase [Bacteroidales bacterium]HRW28074.1 GH92 family glycosyl hydrolase [Bacteroidales bacterium]